MDVDPGAVIDALYIRGELSAPALAGGLGEGVESIDVSVQLMELLLEGIVQEVRGRPPGWRLTEEGVAMAWKRKAQQAG